MSTNDLTRADMNTYHKQAEDFLLKTGATIDVAFVRSGKHFEDDEDNRDIYSVTIKRGGRSFTFNFGQSLNNSGFYYQMGRRKYNIDRKQLGKTMAEMAVTIKSRIDYTFNKNCDTIHFPTQPHAYDILASMTKYNPGTFNDFCSEYGYDDDNIKAEKIWRAVQNEYNNLCALFNEQEMMELAEIN